MAIPPTPPSTSPEPRDEPEQRDEPAASMPADAAPADETPADETPADETPADEALADETEDDDAAADSTELPQVTGSDEPDGVAPDEGDAEAEAPTDESPTPEPVTEPVLEPAPEPVTESAAGYTPPTGAGYPSAPVPPPAPGSAPVQLPAPVASPAAAGPASPVPAPGGAAPAGFYPQESFYAPGWTPEQAAPPATGRNTTRAVLWTLIGVLSAVLVTGIVFAVLYLVQTRTIGTVTSATTVTTQQVRPGHCIRDLPEDGSVGRVTLVPCSEPHEAQALARTSLDYDGWPGQSVVDEDAAGACEMSSAQVEAGFRGVTWTPSESGWARGDHQALCIAWLPNGQFTGSFEDGDVQVP